MFKKYVQKKVYAVRADNSYENFVKRFQPVFKFRVFFWKVENWKNHYVDKNEENRVAYGSDFFVLCVDYKNVGQCHDRGAYDWKP